LAEIKDKRMGFEGILPLPPGKYHLDFLLTDWQKKTGFQTDREVDVPPIDELREVRRRLATEVEQDVERYAKMLADTAGAIPGNYVAKPLVPQTEPAPRPAKAS